MCCPRCFCVAFPFSSNTELCALVYVFCARVSARIGAIHQVDVLTGWIHHPVYVYLTLRTIREKVVGGIVPHFIEVRFIASSSCRVTCADSSLPDDSIPVVCVWRVYKYEVVAVVVVVVV